MKYRFIREQAAANNYENIGTERMCQLLDVSRSGYYRWLKKQSSLASDRDKENQRLLERIRTLHEESRGVYGSPKVQRRLRQEGIEVNHKRVERLMREEGLRAKRSGRKYRPQTTDSRHSLPVAENRLSREFKAGRPDQKWVSDITYIWTDEGWLYLAVFLDLYSRMVVGWATADRVTAELVERAFLQGQRRRGRAVTPLVHSDRGSQYASAAFRQKLSAWECQQSMSRKANCWDNAVAESFFSVLKEELIHHERFATRQEAKDKLFDYIEVFYNRQRIHSAAEYLSPAEYEARFKQAA
jgi:putative transposase